jgi:hypothetical protein
MHRMGVLIRSWAGIEGGLKTFHKMSLTIENPARLVLEPDDADGILARALSASPTPPANLAKSHSVRGDVLAIPLDHGC